MAQRPSRDITPLYFAFPDGALHYVCAECNALCCRGHGFAGSVRREIPALLTFYPALGSMVVGRRGDIVTFQTLPGGGCSFLQSDNLCGVEVKHGRAVKPGVCIVFPFNAFTRIGNTVAVSPHFLCPLRLQVPARPDDVAGTHAVIERTIRETGLLEPGHVAAHMDAVPLHKSEKVTSVLTREASFRDACSAGLGQRRFGEVVRAASADAKALDTFLERAAKILAVPGRALESERDRIDDVLLVLAPSLRLGLLQLPREGILRALLVGELVVRNVFSLQSDPPGLQEAHRIFLTAGPTLRLLASNDEPLELARKIDPKVPPLGEPELIFAAYAALRELGKSAAVLTVVERTIKDSFTTADRSILLHALARQVDAARSRRRAESKGAKPIPA